jgi:indolepyruvate ferredoxin oxidoreductase beta subunit
VAAFPAPLRPLLGEAVARLVDYQDVRYAERYLQRLEPFVGPDADLELAAVVARHLAVWMTYEDAIRVADLKTRASRFARLRAEAGPEPVELEVTDYLKPELDELYGLLPAPLAAPLARWAERRWPTRRPALGQRVRTSTVLGFLRLWVLARCRWLRPSSYRARLEHARIERWLAAVATWVRRDPTLAGELARAAQLVKGYGEVRRRLTALFDHLVASVSRVAALEVTRGTPPVVARALARVMRTRVLEGSASPSEIMALAEDTVRRVEQEGPQAALARLEGV